MTIEEEPIDQASSARRERLNALRAAQELSTIPDDGSVTNGTTGQDSAAQNSSEKEVMSVEEDSIEQAAAARRERLKTLRTAKELLSTPDESSTQNGDKGEDSEETEEEKKLNMKFRNYLPHDKHLQEGKLASTALPKFEDPVAAAPPASDNIEDPFVNIAPKKPNWDLRRDVQKRLDKLERRTQKAIYQLMQEQEQEKEDMETENLITEEEDMET